MSLACAAGAAFAGAVPLVLYVVSGLLASGIVVPAEAANGQCVWEGGPGAAGGHLYCAAEDCIGSGGLAQCSAGIAAAALPYTDEQVADDKWVYSMCDDTASYITNIRDWCIAAGGDWIVRSNGLPDCVDLPSDILGGGGTTTNSESRAVSISDSWVGIHLGCGTLQSDTSWGASISSNWCWSGSMTEKLDISTRELRRRKR